MYGTTRMRRSCDWLVDRFLTRAPDPVARAALRVGAYQLEFLRTPPHAAVGATVAAAPARARGLVNAVLRKVATAGHPGDEGAVQGWPGMGVRLSYPDWIVERLVADLGAADATAALEAMDRPPPVTRRDDGYTQDQASQWVAEAVGAGPGDLVADVCAAPGGKATAMARSGAALVVGAEPPAVAGGAGRRQRRPGGHAGWSPPSSPTVVGRRCGPGRSTGSWSTLPAPGWACCAAGPTPAGA